MVKCLTPTRSSPADFDGQIADATIGKIMANDEAGKQHMAMLRALSVLNDNCKYKLQTAA